MSSESPTNKLQSVLWWITSIAVSVLCCSVLFVLFASYLVEMKQSAKENELRITAIEEREDRILAELEMIRKHTLAQNAVPAVPGAAAESPATATTTEGQASVPVVPASPAATTPAVSPASPATPTVPPSSGAAVQVPAMVPTAPATK